MLLDGRPLLAYSVLLARAIPEIDHVVVASDGMDILLAGARWGAQTCLLPRSLTTDDATLLGTLTYVVELGGDWNPPPEWVCLLQPTSPLRLVVQCRGWIRDALRARPPCDGLLTVDRQPYKLASATPEGYYLPEYLPGAPKQSIEPRLRENGLFYLLEADNLRQGRLFGPRMLYRECRWEQSVANVDWQHEMDFCRWAFHYWGYATAFANLERALT